MLRNFLTFLSCFVEIKMNICDTRGIPLPKWAQMASVLSLVHQALKQVPNAQFLGVDLTRMW